MGLFLLYWGEDVRGALLRVSTAMPMRRMRGYRGRIFPCPPLSATIEGEIAQEPERCANEDHQRCSSHHREGWRNRLAHIKSVDWLPADMKVVGALEKRERRAGGAEKTQTARWARAGSLAPTGCHAVATFEEAPTDRYSARDSASVRSHIKRREEVDVAVRASQRSGCRGTHLTSEARPTCPQPCFCSYGKEGWPGLPQQMDADRRARPRGRSRRMWPSDCPRPPEKPSAHSSSS